MNKGLIFFCCSCVILLFTIINLSVGPVISGAVGRSGRIGELQIANIMLMNTIGKKELNLMMN